MIGVAAPSGPVDIDKFDVGIDVLKKMGFEVVVPDDLFKPQSYLAGSDSHRAAMLNRMFLSPEIDAIICARGGFGSMRILSKIDYEGIREHPKMFIGFSDVSALLANLYGKSDLVVFHGPVVTTLSDFTDSAIDGFYEMLTGDPTDIEIELNDYDTIHPGEAFGPVIGGNLTTLCHLTGTPYQPDYHGHILFIEDIGEALYRIDRMLTQMILSGCLDGLSGLALGAFENCGDVGEVYELVKEKFGKEKFPILAGFEIGHITNNSTVPIGLHATLDADNGLLSFQN